MGGLLETINIFIDLEIGRTLNGVLHGTKDSAMQHPEPKNSADNFRQSGIFFNNMIWRNFFHIALQ